MADPAKPPFAADPAFNWSCETCKTVQLGPEYPGYTPHCPACGAQLIKTPVSQQQP